MLKWTRKKQFLYKWNAWITLNAIVLRSNAKTSVRCIFLSKKGNVSKNIKKKITPANYFNLSRTKEVKKALKQTGKQAQLFCYLNLDMRLKNVGDLQDGWNVLSLDNEIKRLKVSR